MKAFSVLLSFLFAVVVGTSLLGSGGGSLTPSRLDVSSSHLRLDLTAEMPSDDFEAALTPRTQKSFVHICLLSEGVLPFAASPESLHDDRTFKERRVIRQV